jgi:superoxide reductase
MTELPQECNYRENILLFPYGANWAGRSLISELSCDKRIIGGTFKPCRFINRMEVDMNRRVFLKSVAVGAFAVGIAREAYGVEEYFPVKVDRSLFRNINRVKNSSNETELEKLHVPVITAPAKVKAGEMFNVEVTIGKTLHPMGPSHWIEFASLSIGNEPAGRVSFQSKGYLKPKAKFTLVLTKESAPSGKATLVVHQRCNLHGYWEGSLDIEVV